MRFSPEGVGATQDQIDQQANQIVGNTGQVDSFRRGNETDAARGSTRFTNWDPLTASFIPSFKSPTEAMQFNKLAYGAKGNQGMKNITKDEAMSFLTQARSSQ
jgi:hypothetical protein